MKAKELIEYLQSVPENTEITIWNDGERLQIHRNEPFDFWDDENLTADINIQTETKNQTK